MASSSRWQSWTDAQRLVSPDGLLVERVLSWLRFPALALIAYGQRLPHPGRTNAAFFVALAVAVGWSCWLFWRMRSGPVTVRFATIVAVLDVVGVSVLAALSGGPVSPASLAFFLVPVVVASRAGPQTTLLATGGALLLYVLPALLHPALDTTNAVTTIVVRGGYLVWIGLGVAMLSSVLRRSRARERELASSRERLLADAMSAGERERRGIAEGLHDSTIQTLLAARFDVEAGSAGDREAAERVDAALRQSVAELRETVFQLHPYVLDQAGLAAALRTAARAASRRSGLNVRLDLSDDGGRTEQDRLVFGVARELLMNVEKHAGATTVDVTLLRSNGMLQLAVADDGVGVAPGMLQQRLAEGHIGLASQRARVEAVGGQLDVRETDGGGTTVEVRVPVEPGQRPLA